MATATPLYSIVSWHASEGDIHIRREETSQQLSRGGRHSCVSPHYERYLSPAGDAL